jgi:integrase
LKLQITGKYKDNGFVFTWEDGRIIEPGTLSKHFKKLILESGFTGIHFHSLRHSYASLMRKADIHPKIVRENLGHSTIAMTLDIYSHVAPGLKETAADKINGLLEIKKLPANCG